MTDDSAQPDGTDHAQERRLHPLTPLRRAWVPVAAMGALTARNYEDFRQALGDAPPLLLAAGVVGLIAIGAGLGFFSWWFTWFAVSGTELRIRTGLVFRRTAHIRLDRIQAVDVTQSLFARVVGVASLKLDVVGASASDVLAYLGEDQARELRAELLRRGGATDQVSPAEAPGATHLLHVPPRVLALALVLWDHVVLQLAIAVVVVIVVAIAAAPAALIALIPIVYQVGSATVGRFLNEYDWTLWATPDGLTVDRGLLQRAHETVPVGRVQSVRLVEPFLWRRLGWVRVEMHVAGSANTVLVPIAPRAHAQEVLTRVLLGHSAPDGAELTRPPRRAARCLPVWWRGHRFGVTDGLFVARKGLLMHRTFLVPHVKAQSVRLTQGPWQRRWGLAHVHVDAAAGPPVTARNRAAEEAQDLFWAQGERSRTARRPGFMR